MKNTTCARCLTPMTRRRAKYCSPECVSEALAENASTLSTPVRNALRDAQTDAEIVAAIRLGTTQHKGSGCWEWLGPTHRGYPKVKPYRGEQLAHRVVLAASLGAPLGDQTAHHKCANRRCVNPAHLQQATNRENVGEMLARQDYIKRIIRLENALREACPEHPLLDEAPLGGIASF